MERATPEELRADIVAYAEGVKQSFLGYHDDSWYIRLRRAATGFGNSPLEHTLVELLTRIAAEQGCLVGGKIPIDIPDDIFARLRDG